jgi:AraC family transcriptional regulator of adaptative response / DNA-3-methyladenine glycosylase II
MVRVDDFESRYLAVASRDRRFEGRFLLAVTSTGVYCRVGCPARTPRREHVLFYRTAAAAEAAGFRPCRRCRPDQDAAPGGALVGRALQLIAAGGVDGAGVAGVSHDLGVSPRTLRRRLTVAVGASPVRIGRSRRLQAARALIAETSMPLTEVAYTAGYNSLRRFNEEVRSELGMSPSALRDPPRTPGGADGTAAGQAFPAWLTLRLSGPAPLSLGPLLAFLAVRTVNGVDSGDGRAYLRSLRTEHGTAVVEMVPGEAEVTLRVRLDDLRDLEDVVRRCRRLLDLDTDTAAVASVLGGDPLLAPLLAAAPGVRIPGSADPFETAVRAVLGQQVSVAAARTLAGRLVDRHGEPLADSAGPIMRLFPTPERLAEGDLAGLGLTGARIRSLRALGQAVASGSLDLSRADPAEIDAALSRLPGFGPWTRAYIAMRARGDPDALPATDLGLRRALERLGAPSDPLSVSRRAEAWRPWRSYAVFHLWSSLPPAAGTAPHDSDTTPLSGDTRHAL